MQRIPQNLLANVLTVMILSASLVLVGCTSLPGQRQELLAKTYLLQVPEDVLEMQVTDTVPCLTLEVNKMRAAPGFSTSRIVYVQKNHQLDYFAQHQWADTPASMLTTIISQALENSHLFRAVVESPAAITSDLRLDSKLLKLQQVFKDDGSILQLQLRIMLIDKASRGVVASHTFRLSETIFEDTPYGAVVAANLALTRLVPELISFIDMATHDQGFGCKS